MKNKKRESGSITLGIGLLIFIAVIFFYFSTLSLPPILKPDAEIRPGISESDDIVEKEDQEVLEPIQEKTVHTSGSIRALEDAKSDLSMYGVIGWTNTYRALEGIAPLRPSESLRVAAEYKVNDMFVFNYFAHVSPEGLGIGDLARMTGYDYISVGENLAVGGFASDRAVVEAWMNSPGHRENILNPAFTEIGVWVEKGEFEGREVWMAVQEFGKPVSECPLVDSNLKMSIDNNREILLELEEDLRERQEILERMEPKQGDEYGSAVIEYNSAVVFYNSLIEETRALVEAYNGQVATFNMCAAG